ncbi:MAG TPA: carbohydrate-binding protein [Polyangiaceae bacterium]|nr:carbohydrate-binding protein [Polyangiaceae bacterium]
MRCAQDENLLIDQAPPFPVSGDSGGTSSPGGSGGGDPISAGKGAAAGTSAGSGASSAGTAGGGGSDGGAAGAADGAAGTAAGNGPGGAGGAAGDSGAAGSEGDAGAAGTPGSGIVGGDPYGGTAWSVPGTVEAEDFDLGGSDVAYSDTTAENFGNTYRTGDGVDIEACSDTGGGYDVGWNFQGEWRHYTIDVQSAGTYTLSARVASPNAGASLSIEVDGVDVTGSMAVPNTGGYQTWQTITKSGVTLGKGIHVIRLEIPASTEFNINWLKFD